MECFVKDCLMIGLKSKGFILDFEAKADIDGGFECYIFSDGNHVAIITSESVQSKIKSGGAGMVYRHYCCPLGDNAYLNDFLESESISEDSSLMTGAHGGLFLRLIEKVRSYGSTDAGGIYKPMHLHDAKDNIHLFNQHSRGKNVIPLFDRNRSNIKRAPLITAAQ